jgi:hypothetical protein
VGLFWLALVGLKPWIRGDFLRAYTHHAVGYRHMYVLYTKQTDLTNPHIEPPSVSSCVSKARCIGCLIFLPHGADNTAVFFVHLLNPDTQNSQISPLCLCHRVEKSDSHPHPH